LQVFAVKARFKYPFGKNAVGNVYNFWGILAGACLMVFVIYPPPLHVVFGGSYHTSPLYWLIPAAFGVVLIAWACIRVLLLRKSIEESRVKDIQGLQMCKCRNFTSFRALLVLKTD
jgi:sodium/potassium-transporting ATPase subunit alpha